MEDEERVKPILIVAERPDGHIQIMYDADNDKVFSDGTSILMGVLSDSMSRNPSLAMSIKGAVARFEEEHSTLKPFENVFKYATQKGKENPS